MKASRKLFLTMASFIVSLTVLFGLVTELIVRESADAAVESTRGKEIEALSRSLIRYYSENGGSWRGVKTPEDIENRGNIAGHSASFLLVSRQNEILLRGGMEAEELLIKRLGIRTPLIQGENTIAFLYYYDPEVAMLSKLRFGIPLSVLFLLVPSAVIFIGISLWVAWWLSKRMTAPLRQLIPVIDRLGKGDYGARAPVAAKDEYGQVAQALNEMAAWIQNAEANRRNLVADVAHELRTPITIIRGKLDLAQHSGRLIEPESLLPLQDELIRLTRLVDDLHLLSLAEAGKLPIERKAVNLRELLLRIIDRVTPDADQKRIRIRLECESDLPAVHADPNRITQVFLNLIVNAIRYTPDEGSVTVTVKTEPAGGEDGGSGYVRTAIADTGPGIEPGHLPHLFDRFYRTDEARARHSGGMGLGLAIAKGFVTAHGGTIDVDSVLGLGTRFIVRLPAASS